ncbi:MAG TPA: Flp family type IVb pilin [Kiloniellaceae bacterium]|nr:Flp family type IVb pilin [Kiloniellaceae bacterium]
MRDTIVKFLKSEDGTTIVEYTFIVALIGLAAIGAFSKFANSVDGLWSFVESSFTNSVK